MSKLKELQARIVALESVIQTIHIYSRRYCDGRSTYAPADHNLATHRLLELGLKLPVDPISTSGPFARDGMYGLLAEDQAVLDEAHLKRVREWK
ncbi:hypothetical protein [Deinococcus humi]|uniref:Uncharacterized protein n=1 Tax=Deinococcus humi TaxID=662880 RepID=A0A7W8ND63_9DEIO|nr:hypothetical protein [Deinococcus humi]MBB5361290.1 hypothetical protein [Deinococcus humi]GGO19343.1 hypothetical protein GCM10008949_03560 [Deinococcus humi]